jgi:putative ABC transport system substrate-binding protein
MSLGADMKRREFITLLGGAAVPVLQPFATRAQQAIPVIGFLNSTSNAVTTHLFAAYRQGLKEAGFIDGQNVAAEYRWAENQLDRLPSLAAELIRRPVAVIVGNAPSALAAKAATTSIPIVFTTGGDPVQDGLVTSLNRPGGNVTGVSFLGAVVGAKRLDLLRQIVPKATTIALLVNPNSPATDAERREVQAAAPAVGLQLTVANVGAVGDLETTFATFVERGVSALIIGGGSFLFSNRERIVALAARHALPAIYTQREHAVAGGLMSYGTSQTDAYRRAGVYAGRILKGERPGDLPVLQAAKFEFVINLKTAKTLGLEFNPQLLSIADELIE